MNALELALKIVADAGYEVKQVTVKPTDADILASHAQVQLNWAKEYGDEYDRGMFNGIEFARSIVAKDCPQYLDAVKKEPEKFVPFIGQIGYVWDENSGGGLDKKFLTAFVSMDEEDRYKCKDHLSWHSYGSWDHFEPIPGLVQMEPYDPAYTGKANVLFECGHIIYLKFSNEADWDYLTSDNGKPISFQKLEK